ncbi:MAG TPA: hypothetical protein PLS77_13050, partial [Anaerolineaceae bacterium]|nr:hypothetical protein [Anaerolineaceae bacterium]
CVGTVPIFGHNGGIQMKDFTILNFLTLTFKIREILQIGHVFQKFIYPFRWIKSRQENRSYQQP